MSSGSSLKMGLDWGWKGTSSTCLKPQHLTVGPHRWAGIQENQVYLGELRRSGTIQMLHLGC